MHDEGWWLVKQPALFLATLLCSTVSSLIDILTHGTLLVLTGPCMKAVLVKHMSGR